MTGADIIDVLAWVYFLGIVTFLIRWIEEASSIQTPHGHAFILAPWFLLVLLWPLIALWIAARWLWERGR